ncbi:MAG: Smr/MutS family protein [Saprospiraceae bacterium]|nr:Smr/MutS family protein [Saprospiraceae bacterium]
MKLSDLWIGDRLYSNALKEIVLFDGEAEEGLARVIHRGVKHHLPVEDLSPAGEEESLINEGKAEEHIALPPRKRHAQTTIDLHYDQGLNASEAAGPVLNILQHQMERCRAFMNAAVEHRMTRLVIIHGKGDQGVLRKAVRSLLETYPEVTGQRPSPDEGSIEVLLTFPNSPQKRSMG